jgi:very-short-patch-repair endonuclease
VGEYIVDFYCPKAKLVIELDGEYHADEEIKKYDRVRDEHIKNLGLTIIRFTNDEVLKNVGRVTDRIVKEIPLGPPLQKGETESDANKKQALASPFRKGRL